MKKQNIETGMLVQLRNGTYFRVVGKTLVGFSGNGWISLDSYCDDLLHEFSENHTSGTSEFDMILVTEPFTGYQLTNEFSPEELILAADIYFEINRVPKVDWGSLPTVEQTDERGQVRLIKVTEDSDTCFSGVVLYCKEGIYDAGYKSKVWSKSGCKTVKCIDYKTED